MSSYFKPRKNEIRVCRLVESGCDTTITTFQDSFTGHLFVSSGNTKYHSKRRSAIDDVINKFGDFLVMFDIHTYSTNGQIDANHFAKYPMFESI